jgi:hypothetical protein
MSSKSRRFEVLLGMEVTALAATSTLTPAEIGEHAKKHLVVLPEVIFMPTPVGGQDIAIRTDFPSQSR